METDAVRIVIQYLFPCGGYDLAFCSPLPLPSLSPTEKVNDLNVFYSIPYNTLQNNSVEMWISVCKFDLCIWICVSRYKNRFVCVYVLYAGLGT